MLYFAYGMNTDPACMPGPGKVIGPGRLHDWKLYLRGFADVQPLEGSHVDGVVWEIDARTLASLDVRESYPRFYERTTVVIVPIGGADLLWTDVIVYYMRDPDAVSRKLVNLPTEHYLEYLVRGYRRFELSWDQVDEALHECRELVLDQEVWG